MRDLLFFAGRTAAIAAAALLGACGGDAGDEPAVNALDAEMTLDEPANDASAIESAVIDPAPAPAMNRGDAAGNASEVLGETSGGDTGGNSADDDVAGM